MPCSARPGTHGGEAESPVVRRLAGRDDGVGVEPGTVVDDVERDLGIHVAQGQADAGGVRVLSGIGEGRLGDGLNTVPSEIQRPLNSGLRWAKTAVIASLRSSEARNAAFHAAT